MHTRGERVWNREARLHSSPSEEMHELQKGYSESRVSDDRMQAHSCPFQRGPWPPTERVRASILCAVKWEPSPGWGGGAGGQSIIAPCAGEVSGSTLIGARTESNQSLALSH